MKNKNFPFGGIILEDNSSHFKVSITCGENEELEGFKIENNTLFIKGLLGCGIRNIFSEFLSKYYIITNLLLIVAGVFLLIFGGH